MKSYKIAIYHGLKQGGGLILVNKIKENLKKRGYAVDIFSPSQDIKYVDNFLGEILTNFVWLNRKDKQISNFVNKNYDFIFVFPSLRLQIPNILRYLKISSCYMFQESRREFFETTSFDHNSLKRTILRFLRLPILFLDYINARYVNKCVTNSIYTQFIARNIYKIKSVAIPPGIERIKPVKILKRKSKAVFSIGPYTKIKGHDFSFKQIQTIVNEVTLIGDINLYDLKKESDTNLKINVIYKPKSIKTYLSTLNNSSVYLANNNFEPFGLATLDATTSKFLVLGLNNGGTSEIIYNGVNGFLYPKNLIISKNILKNIISKKSTTFYNISKYNWSRYVDKLIYESLPHPPHPHPQQPGKH